MGCKTLKTSQTVNKYLGALRSGMNYTNSARAAGICVTTINDWKRADPEFAEACEEAEAQGLQKVEDVLLEKALGGHFPSIQLYLERRSRKRWAPPNKTPAILLDALHEAQEDDAPIEEVLRRRILELQGLKPEPSRNGHVKSR